jgi:hypothetical protein
VPLAKVSDPEPPNRLPEGFASASQLESGNLLDSILYLMRGPPNPADSSYSEDKAMRYMPNLLSHIATGHYDGVYRTCRECVSLNKRSQKIKASLEAEVRSRAREAFGAPSSNLARRDDRSVDYTKL